MTHRMLGLVAGSLLLRVLVLGQIFGEITGVVTDASLVAPWLTQRLL